MVKYQYLSAGKGRADVSIMIKSRDTWREGGEEREGKCEGGRNGANYKYLNGSRSDLS